MSSQKRIFPKPKSHRSAPRDQEETRRYLRFPLIYRLEHWVFMASFTILGLTGLVQKYAKTALAKDIIGALGGIETTRIIHHYAAILMMLVTVYHLGALGYRLFVKRVYPTMLPGIGDMRLALQALLYNLGLKKVKPQQGRYTFEEKMEYWAVVWGTVVMAITGFMMWNPISTARFFPGEFIPAAKAAHGGEALLAVLAIILWHLYHVIIRHWNKSIFTGYLTEDEMLDDHPLELADIKAGLAERPVAPRLLARRKRVFFPSYTLIAAGLLVGIYYFIAYEQTAVATVPPAETVKIFAPFTPTPLPTPLPTATPAPVTAYTWEGAFAALFQQKCSTCHSGTSKLGGLDLSSYATALSGGNSGAAIVPGDPDTSVVIIKQSAGNHPAQLSGEELAQIRAWIEAGAPEK